MKNKRECHGMPILGDRFRYIGKDDSRLIYWDALTDH